MTAREVPKPGIYWDRHSGEPVIVVVLDPDEARAIAESLPAGDSGGRELTELVARAAELLRVKREGAWET